MRFFTIPVYLFVFLLAACDSSGNADGIGLGGAAMSVEVDTVTKAPIESSNVFLASTPALQATIKLRNASVGTTVTARFYFGSMQKKKEIASDAITTSGTGYLSFALDPPASGWPLGTYQVEFYLENEMKESLTFFIKSQLQQESETSVAGTASPVVTDDSDPEFRLFNDDQFGFSMELPANWNFRVVGENSDYLFQGPSGSEEGEIVLIIQMIDTRLPPKTTLSGEMSNQVSIFRKRAGVKIVKQSELLVAGGMAPYFLATYPIKNDMNQLVSWGHTQLGLQNGPVILLISYAAPREIYQDTIGLFQHMVDTFLLKTPKL